MGQLTPNRAKWDKVPCRSLHLVCIDSATADLGKVEQTESERGERKSEELGMRRLG